MSDRFEEGISGDPLRFDERNPWVDLCALPIAILITLLSKWLVWPDLLTYFLFRSAPHELGHSITAWLAGRFMIPIGAFVPIAGYSYGSMERSTFVVAAVGLALAFGFYFALQRKWEFLLVVVTGAIYFWYRLSWRATPQQADLAIVWGGCGGELILDALFIVAFYYRMPARLRWDFVRFVFLFIGAYCFVSSYQMWRDIAAKTQELPLGSMLGGSGDSGGDMNRLRDEFGWSEPQIVRSFLRMGHLCALAVAAHYVNFAFQAWQRFRRED